MSHPGTLRKTMFDGNVKVERVKKIRSRKNTGGLVNVQWKWGGKESINRSRS